MGSICGFTGSWPDALMFMKDRLRHWQPDKEGCFQNEDVSLASFELFNTPEAKYIYQPFLYKDIVVIADCRIDNRQQLAKELDLPALLHEADVFLIAVAYEKWGTDCVKHLYGDFAFAIWNKSKKILFCARDHIGIKTFYHTVVNDQFIFSNEIKGITAYPEFKGEANDNYFVSSIGEVDASEHTTTPYANIWMLAPGHSLEWHLGQLKISSYWEFGKSIPIVTCTEDDYIPQFRDLLFESVKCRLRTPYGVGAEVSGGLDSTSIAAVAMEILGKGAPFHSFCYGKPQNDRFDVFGDDTDLVKDFCNQYKIPGYLHIVNEADYPWPVAEDLLLNVYDEDEATTVPFLTGSFLPVAKTAGVRVMLSGHGGDHVVSNLSRGFYVQNAINRNYICLWRNLYSEFGLRRCIPRFVYYIIRGLKKTAISAAVGKRTLQMARNNGLKADVIERYNLVADPADVDLLSASSLAEKYIRNIRSNVAVKRANHHDLVGKHFNLEYRFPLLDVRLIEFTLAIAPYVQKKYGSQREFYRLAVKDYLPPTIWDNRKSKVPTTPFIKAFYKRNEVLIKKRREAGTGGLARFFDETKLSQLSTKLNLKLIILNNIYNRIK